MQRPSSKLPTRVIRQRNTIFLIFLLNTLKICCGLNFDKTNLASKPAQFVRSDINGYYSDKPRQVIPFGDLDCNGVSDWMLGAPDSGGFVVLMRDPMGNILSRQYQNNDTLPSYSQKFEANSGLGHSLTKIGQFEGSGGQAFVVGAPYGAHVLMAQWNATAMPEVIYRVPSGPFSGMPSDFNDTWFGYSVTGIGDLNSDGYDEFVVGAPLTNNLGTKAGGLYVIFSGPTGAASIVPLIDAAGMLPAVISAYSRLGWALASPYRYNANEDFSSVVYATAFGDNSQNIDPIIIRLEFDSNGLIDFMQTNVFDSTTFVTPIDGVSYPFVNATAFSGFGNILSAAPSLDFSSKGGYSIIVSASNDTTAAQAIFGSAYIMNFNVTEDLVSVAHIDGETILEIADQFGQPRAYNNAIRGVYYLGAVEDGNYGPEYAANIVYRRANGSYETEGMLSFSMKSFVQGTDSKPQCDVVYALDVHSSVSTPDLSGLPSATSSDDFRTSLLSDYNDNGLPEIAIGFPSANSGDGALYIVFPEPVAQVFSNVIEITRTSPDGVLFGLNLANIKGFGKLSSNCIADFDVDGVLDIIVGAPDNSYGALVIILMNNDGTVKDIKVIDGANGWDTGIMNPLISGISSFGLAGAEPLPNIWGTSIPIVAVPYMDSQLSDPVAIMILRFDDKCIVQSVSKLVSINLPNKIFSNVVFPNLDISGDGILNELIVGGGPDLNIAVLELDSDGSNYTVSNQTIINTWSRGVLNPADNTISDFVKPGGCDVTSLTVLGPRMPSAVYDLVVTCAQLPGGGGAFFLSIGSEGVLLEFSVLSAHQGWYSVAMSPEGVGLSSALQPSTQFISTVGGGGTFDRYNNGNRWMIFSSSNIQGTGAMYFASLDPANVPTQPMPTSYTIGFDTSPGNFDSNQTAILNITTLTNTSLAPESRSLVKLQDLDCDGNVEFVLGLPESNNGSGGFAILFRHLHQFDPQTTLTFDELSDGAEYPALFVGKSEFGRAITNMGDLNGDGIFDLLIGAPGYGPHGAVVTVHLRRSKQNGAGLAKHISIFQPPENVMAFGHSVSRIADLDGNGYPEAIVGAPKSNSSTGVEESGAFYILYMNSSGVERYVLHDSPLNGVPSGDLRPYGHLGSGVAWLGEHSDDETMQSIVAISAQGDAAKYYLGFVLLFDLSSSGSVQQTWSLSDSVAGDGSVVNNLIRPEDEFGSFLSCVASLDAEDRTPDIVLGAHLFSDGSSYLGGFLILHMNSAMQINSISTISPDYMLDLAHQATEIDPPNHSLQMRGLYPLFTYEEIHDGNRSTYLSFALDASYYYSSPIYPFIATLSIQFNGSNAVNATGPKCDFIRDILLTSAQDLTNLATASDSEDYQVCQLQDIRNNGAPQFAVGVPSANGGRGALYMISTDMNGENPYIMFDISPVSSLGIAYGLSNMSLYGFGTLSGHCSTPDYFDNSGTIVVGAPYSQDAYGTPNVGTIVLLGYRSYGFTEASFIDGRDVGWIGENPLASGLSHRFGWQVEIMGRLSGGPVPDLLVSTPFATMPNGDIGGAVAISLTSKLAVHRARVLYNGGPGGFAPGTLRTNQEPMARIAWIGYDMDNDGFANEYLATTGNSTFELLYITLSSNFSVKVQMSLTKFQFPTMSSAMYRFSDYIRPGEYITDIAAMPPIDPDGDLFIFAISTTNPRDSGGVYFLYFHDLEFHSFDKMSSYIGSSEYNASHSQSNVTLAKMGYEFGRDIGGLFYSSNADEAYLLLGDARYSNYTGGFSLIAIHANTQYLSYKTVNPQQLVVSPWQLVDPVLLNYTATDLLDIHKGDRGISTADDFDCNGVTDLIVGLPTSSNTSCGIMLISLNKDYTVKSKYIFDATVAATRGIDFNSTNSTSMGTAVAALEDLDGNGAKELIVGDPYNGIGGKIHIIFTKKSSQLENVIDNAITWPEDPASMGFGPSMEFGASVAAVGDLDGNGIADCVVGAPGASFQFWQSGGFYVLYMNETGVMRYSATVDYMSGAPSQAFVANGRLGTAIARLDEHASPMLPWDQQILISTMGTSTEPARIFAFKLQGNGFVNSYRILSASPSIVGGSLDNIMTKYGRFGVQLSLCASLDGDDVPNIVVTFAGNTSDSLNMHSRTYILSVDTYFAVSGITTITREDHASFATQILSMPSYGGLVLSNFDFRQVGVREVTGYGALPVFMGRYKYLPDPSPEERLALMSFNTGPAQGVGAPRCGIVNDIHLYTQAIQNLDILPEAASPEDYYVSFLEDYTEDGIREVAVGVPSAYNDSSGVPSGALYILSFGSDLSVLNITEISIASEAGQSVGLDTCGLRGFGVLSPHPSGDFDLDGVPDIVVGAPLTASDTDTAVGAFAILLMNDKGAAKSIEVVNATTGWAASLPSFTSSFMMGTCVEVCGYDFSQNPGPPSIMVCAPGSATGSVYLISIDSNMDVSSFVEINDMNPNIGSLYATGNFKRVTWLGDVDGDGNAREFAATFGSDDGFLLLILDATGAVYYNTRNWLQSMEGQTNPLLYRMSQYWQAADSLYDLAGVPSLNNDTVPDLVITTPYDANGGTVYILYLRTDYYVDSFDRINTQMFTYNISLTPSEELLLAGSFAFTTGGVARMSSITDTPYLLTGDHRMNDGKGGFLLTEIDVESAHLLDPENVQVALATPSPSVSASAYPSASMTVSPVPSSSSSASVTASSVSSSSSSASMTASYVSSNSSSVSMTASPVPSSSSSASVSIAIIPATPTAFWATPTSADQCMCPCIVATATPTATTFPSTSPSITSSASVIASSYPSIVINPSATSTPSASPTPSVTATPTPSNSQAPVITIQKPPTFMGIDEATRTSSKIVIDEAISADDSILQQGYVYASDIAGGTSPLTVDNIQCATNTSIYEIFNHTSIFAHCAANASNYVPCASISSYFTSSVVNTGYTSGQLMVSSIGIKAGPVLTGRIPMPPTVYESNGESSSCFELLVTVNGTTKLQSSFIIPVYVTRSPMFSPSPSTTPATPSTQASRLPGASFSSTPTRTPTPSITSTATPQSYYLSASTAMLRFSAIVGQTANGPNGLLNSTFTVSYSSSTSWRILSLPDTLAQGTRQWVKLVSSNALSSTNSRILVSVNSTGLSAGTYQQNLILQSQSSSKLQQTIQLRLTVSSPIARVQPKSFDLSIAPNDQRSTVLQLNNIGDAPMQWYFLPSSSFPSAFTLPMITSGVILPHQSYDIEIDFDATGLTNTVVRSSFDIVTNAPVGQGHLLSIPLNMIVSNYDVCPEPLSATLSPGESRVLLFELNSLSQSDLSIRIYRLETTASWLKLPVRASSTVNTLKAAGAPLQSSLRVENIRDPVTGTVLAPGDYATEFVIESWNPSISGAVRDIRKVATNIVIQLGPPDASQTSVNTTWGSNILQADSNDVYKVSLTLRDAYGFGPVEIGTLIPAFSPLSGSGNGSVRLSLDSMENGTFIARLIPDGVGTMKLDVTINGQPVQGGQGSPLSLEILPAQCNPSYEALSEDELSCECLPGFMAPSRNISMSDESIPRCIPCEYGTTKSRLSSSLQCSLCGIGTYSNAARTECLPCPENGVRCVGGRVSLENGWWCEQCISAQMRDSILGADSNRLLIGSAMGLNSSQDMDLDTMWQWSSRQLSSVDSNILLLPADESMHECIPSSACTVNNNNTQVTCVEGHRGPLCALCKSGWAKSNPETRCIECPSKSVSFGTAVALMVTLFIIVGFLAGSISGGSKSGRIVAVFRVASNWLQMMGLLLTLKIWPDYVTDVFIEYIGDTANVIAVLATPMQCTTDASYYEKLYFVVSLPFIAIFFAVAIGLVTWTIKLCLSKCYSKSIVLGGNTVIRSNVNDEGEKTLRNDRTKSIGICSLFSLISLRAFIVLLFLVYFTVSDWSIATLDFYEKPIFGETYLRRDFRSRKSDPEYNQARIIAIAALVVVSAGLPILAGAMLYKYRRALLDPMVHTRWGFLYSGLDLHAVQQGFPNLSDTESPRRHRRRKRRSKKLGMLSRIRRWVFLWEVVFVSMRKVSIMAIGLLVTQPITQSALVLSVLVISLVLHVVLKPYADTIANELEGISLTVLVINTFMALVLTDGSLLSETADTVIRIIAMTVTIGFCCAIVFTFLRVTYDNMRTSKNAVHAGPKISSSGSDQSTKQDTDEINSNKEDPLNPLATQVSLATRMVHQLSSRPASKESLSLDEEQKLKRTIKALLEE